MMGRIVNTEGFGKRYNTPKIRQLKKIIILLMETRSLEYEYFSRLKYFQTRLGVDNQIFIDTYDEYTNNEIEKLLKYITINYSCMDSNDSIWIFFDKDKLKNSEISLSKFKINNPLVNIAAVNPCFNLWIFLHMIKDLDDYNEEVLLKNNKTNNKDKRYIDLLIKKLSANNPRFSIDSLIDLDKIKNALKLEEKLDNNELDSSGLASNIGEIIKILLDD